MYGDSIHYYDIWVRVRYSHPYKDELLDRDFDVKIHSFDRRIEEADVLEYAEKLAKNNPMFKKVTVIKTEDLTVKEIKQ